MSPSKSNTVPKCDRALALHEKGMPNWAIAERLSISPGHVNAAIRQALARRKKATKEINSCSS
jgi:DNA-binding NarL/FixJ family response regulator